MRIGVVVVLLACGAASACGAPVAPTDDLRVTVADDRSCQPDGIDLVRISALGDFPSTSRTIAQYSPLTAPARYDAFPIDTELLTADTQTTIGGVTVALSGSRQLTQTGVTGNLLLLPQDRPCGVADDRIAMHDGTAVVALPDGGALFVGGIIAGGVQSQVLRLDAGATSATLLAAGDGLSGPRANAAATLGATRDGRAIVVVAGGQSSSALLGSIEIYDVAAGRFDARRCPAFTMMQARARAGAGALPDGRVLVTGGVDLAGHAIGNGELLDLTRCTATRINMPKPVVASWVGALDDGTVIVAGGELDTFGTRTPNPNIWVFSADDLSFAPYPDGLAFRALDDATVVPLAGARLAHVGLSGATLQVEVLYTTGSPYVNTVDIGATLPTFSHVRAAALPDGRLLAVGADLATSAAATIIDLNRGTLTPVSAKVRATELLTLADGVVLELAPEGASLRRTSNLTAFDNPARLVGIFLADIRLDDVALDDSTHWAIVGNTLVAQATPSGEARLDAATLRWGDAHITIDISVGALGNATLLLSAVGLTTKTISITDTQVTLAGCGGGIARTPGATVTVDRRGDSLVLATGSATKTCAATFGGERFGLGLSAREGAVLTTLEIQRLN